jgi:RNA polymerase sigma-70 factor (sigma-E family)
MELAAAWQGARSRLVEEVPGPRILGSRESFEEFYASEYPAVVGLAYALSGNRWVAEDLAQEAFLAAHRRWDRIATYERPGAWVRRVVANLSVSAFRRSLAEAKALASLAFGQPSTLAELSVEDVEFWRAVRRLPRRQAQVVALHYLEDRPVSQIADVLGMAIGTVKKHLHDGRRELARRLELEEDEA